MVEITFINSLSFIAPFPPKQLQNISSKCQTIDIKNFSFASMIQVQNRSMKAAKSFLLFELVGPISSF